MESNKKALARQQMVLAALGFYSGKFDGIWSKKTIEAKVDFECSGKFNPGLPNRGLPFDTVRALPSGLYVDPTIHEYTALTCPEFEAKRSELESQLKLQGEGLASEDKPIEAVGQISVMSEVDLNAKPIEAEEKVKPYEPGLSEAEPPLESAAPKEVVQAEVEDDVPADFAGFGVGLVPKESQQESEEVPEEESGTAESAEVSHQDDQNKQRHHKRNKRRHRPS